MIHPADAHLVAQRSTNDKEKHLKIQTQIDYAETPIPIPPPPRHHSQPWRANSALNFLTQAVPFEKLASRDV